MTTILENCKWFSKVLLIILNFRSYKVVSQLILIKFGKTQVVREPMGLKWGFRQSDCKLLVRQVRYKKIVHVKIFLIIVFKKRKTHNFIFCKSFLR